MGRVVLFFIGFVAGALTSSKTVREGLISATDAIIGAIGAVAVGNAVGAEPWT